MLPSSNLLPPTITPSTVFVKPFWQAATWWGIRRLTGFLQTNVGAYSDTITHFDTCEKVVALTIDDGLCRTNKANSLVSQVAALLEQYQAHATFFVCTRCIV